LIRALITGVNGFVGPYLAKELQSNGYLVFGCSLEKDSSINMLEKYFSCDVTNINQVRSVIELAKPDVIFHLAGFSSVSKSFENPDLCNKINVGGTKNILDSIKMLNISPKLICISSAEVYGQPKKNPVNERAPLQPNSPYGLSKVEQEKLISSYSNSIIVRAFNHTGQNQPDTFVIPSFQKQVTEAKNGSKIFVGNIDIIRDFSDVNDVVKAYRIISEKGVSGEVYNVGSGKGLSLKKILENMIKKSGKDLKITVDSSKFRKAYITELICDNTKIKKLGIKVKSYFD